MEGCRQGRRPFVRELPPDFGARRYPIGQLLKSAPRHPRDALHLIHQPATTWSTTPDKRREAVIAAGPPRHLRHAQSDTVGAPPTARASQPNGPLACRQAGLSHLQLVHSPVQDSHRVPGPVATNGEEGSGPASQGRGHDMPVLPLRGDAMDHAWPRYRGATGSSCLDRPTRSATARAFARTRRRPSRSMPSHRCNSSSRA
jgi:hypothetical protein